MSELSEDLLNKIINEASEKVVALFGGGFKPPTKGHLEVVNQGIKTNPEVTEVIIFVGGGERNGFTQSQAVKIWNLYNDLGFINKPAKIEPVSSPFDGYKDHLRKYPNDKVYVFIGSRPNDEDDQKDVKQRSEFVKNYSKNVIPKEIGTAGGVSGTEARELFLSGDTINLRNMFPENLLDEDFDKILDILNNEEKKSKEVISNKTEPLKPINEDIIDKTDFVLPRGKKMILQAEDEDYNRGLIVELTNEGGYKMYYWYGDDAEVYPVEVEVDGESIKPDAREVYMKFHPELKENKNMKNTRLTELIKSALMGPVKEANAFIVAADKAKDAGKKEFEFPEGSGKMHPVKIKADIDESFDSLVKKVDKAKGYTKKEAEKVAGAIAAKKMKGAGKGPTAKQKKRMAEEILKELKGNVNENKSAVYSLGKDLYDHMTNVFKMKGGLTSPIKADTVHKGEQFTVIISDNGGKFDDVRLFIPIGKDNVNKEYIQKNIVDQVKRKYKELETKISQVDFTSGNKAVVTFTLTGPNLFQAIAEHILKELRG